MKKLWLMGMALGAVIGAQAQQSGDSVTIPPPQRKIEAPAQYHTLRWYQFDQEVRGAYSLSNGQSLYLSRDGTSMYAEIDNEGPHRIVATERNTFVALDGKLQVRLETPYPGKFGGEVLIARSVRSADTGEMSEQVVALAMR